MSEDVADKIRRKSIAAYVLVWQRESGSSLQPSEIAIRRAMETDCYGDLHKAIVDGAKQ
jgi:hypothetical protein